MMCNRSIRNSAKSPIFKTANEDSFASFKICAGQVIILPVHSEKTTNREVIRYR